MCYDTGSKHAINRQRAAHMGSQACLMIHCNSICHSSSFKSFRGQEYETPAPSSCIRIRRLMSPLCVQKILHSEIDFSLLRDLINLRDIVRELGDNLIFCRNKIINGDLAEDNLTH